MVKFRVLESGMNPVQMGRTYPTSKATRRPQRPIGCQAPSGWCFPGFGDVFRLRTSPFCALNHNFEWFYCDGISVLLEVQFKFWWWKTSILSLALPRFRSVISGWGSGCMQTWPTSSSTCRAQLVLVDRLGFGGGFYHIVGLKWNFDFEVLGSTYDPKLRIYLTMKGSSSR